MRRKGRLSTFSLLTLVALLMTGCGGNDGGYVLPTLAPQNTPTPALEENNGPTPTVAPDAGNIKIIELDGENFNQTSYFKQRGLVNIAVKPVAHNGEFSFYVSNREDSSSCVYLDFSDTSGNITNVCGKLIHVAAWVYQETGASSTFVFRLQGKKPDGSADSPESVTISGVQSGQWALIEGDIPVYSNLSSPTISLEMSSSKDPYYFDDIRVTYNPGSAIPANTAYNISNFATLSYDFEDGEVHFAPRGTGNPSVVGSGFNGSSNCLFVSGRSASWNGVQLDLSEYNVAGTDIWVSYAAKHAAKQKTKVICTLQWRAVGTTADKYSNITATEVVLPNEWAEGKGMIRIPANAESAIIYFETEGTDDFYLDNVIVSDKDPSKIQTGGNQGGNQSGGQVDAGSIDVSKFVTIHSLSGENDKETQIFSSRGSATLEIQKRGYSGSCFKISGRTAAWNGIGIDFKNLNNESFDVIGKQVYISYWVYQDSGEPVEFSSTLQVNKPDGSATWPERVTVETLQSGKWTHVEGLIPVYANVKVPQINFEIPGSDTADFLLDEIVIAYDPNSSVEPNPEFVIAEKVPFSTINLTFEDNEALFVSRGDGKPSIVYGGHESDMCLAVTGRKANWHGVQADLSQYDLAGRTIDVTYWVYHEYTTPLQVNMTAEQNDGETTTYIPVVAGDAQEDGKWVKYNNTYTVPNDVKKFILYFESPEAEASFFIDDITIKLQ